METIHITPILIGENPAVESWLTDCLEEAPAYTYEPLSAVPTSDLRQPADGETAIAFADLSGLEVAEIGPSLEAMQERLPSSPLVALVASEEAGAATLAAGACDYLIPDETDGRLLARAVRYALREKRLEQQLSTARQDAQFRQFLESAPDLIYVLDLSDRCLTYVNRDTMFGYPADELRQPDILEQLIHPQDRPLVQQHWERLSTAAPGEMFSTEFRLRPKNGDFEWVQSRETVLSGDDSLQALVSLSVITKRKERQSAVRRYAERLQILHDIDQAIVASRSPQTIAQATLRRIRRLVPCRRASIAVFNQELETFTVLAESPKESMGTGDNSPLPLSWVWSMPTLQRGDISRLDDLDQLAPDDATPLTTWLRDQGIKSLVSVPLRAQRQLIGALNFGRAHTGAFSAEDVVVMREVAHVLAIGLSQARLYEQAQYHARKLEQRAKRLLLVNDISLAVNRPVELNAVLETAAEGLVSVIDVRQVGIALLNEERDTWSLLASHSARKGSSLQKPAIAVREKALLQQLWQTDSFLTLDRAAQVARLSNLRRLLLERDGDNLLLFPVQVRDEVIGVIACDIGPGERNFSREETGLVQTMANLLSVKIEHLRLLEAERSARAQAESNAADLRLREHHLTILNAINRATTGLETEEMLQTAAERLGELSDADGCYVNLWDEEQLAPVPTAAYGTLRETYGASGVQSLTQAVLEAGEPLQLHSTKASPPASPQIAHDLPAKSALVVPLVAGKEKLGALIVTFNRPYDFPQNEVNLYEQAAGQIALALSAARLFNATRRQLEELKVLHALATAGAESRSEDELLEKATQLMEEMLFPDNVGVLLFDEGEQVLSRHYSYRAGDHAAEDVHLPLGEGICGHVAKSGEPLHVPDVTQDERYVEVDPETRSELCVPLKAGPHLIGVINVESKEHNAFSQTDQRLLMTLSHQLATALEKLRLLQAERRQRREAETASEVLRRLNATPNVREAFAGVAARIRAISGSYRVSLALLNEAGDAFTIFALDQPESEEHEERWYPLESTTAAEDVLAGRVHLTPDLAEERDGLIENALYEAGQRSRMNIPLRVGDAVVGALNLTWRETEGYVSPQLPLLSQIAGALALAVERSRLFTQIQSNLMETEALYQISRSLIAAENLPDLLQAVVNNVAEAVPADRAILATVDLEAQEITDYVLDDVGHLSFERATFDELWEGLSGWVLREQQPLLSGKEDPDPRESPAIRASREAAGVGSIIVVPLRYRDKVLGTITAINDADGPDFTERNVELTAAMANQAAVAIENAQLFAETRRRAEELEILGNLSASLRVAHGAREIIDIVVASSAELFSADVAVIAVPGRDPDTLILTHGVGIPDAILERPIHVDDSIMGHVFTTGKPYRTANVLQDPRAHRATQTRWRGHNPQPEAAIYAPLQAGSQITGIVCVMTGAGHTLTEEDLRLLTAMAEIAGSALHRARLMETLEQRVQERTRELAEANEQLKELDRLKSKFVSDVSHELRTPITSLSLYMDLIEEGKAEQTDRYWGVLRKQTNRLNKLIEDILSLSRLELGKVDHSFAPVDLNELLEDVLEMHEKEFEAAGLTVEFQPDRSLLPVQAQPEQLHEIASNLLLNALNYTPEGQVKVSTYCDEEMELACLRIDDSGVGIDEDDLPHIFERFYRGQHAGQSNIPGTGLGLTIVEEAVNLHNGRIDVESEEGQGTTVRVWLPVAPDS